MRQLTVENRLRDVVCPSGYAAGLYWGMAGDT